MTVPRRGSIRLKHPRYRLSPVTATVFAVLLVAGAAQGAAEYARRSPKTEQHVAGANAITLHILIAVAAAAAVISIQARQSRRPARQREPSPWAAPFSVSAASRLRRTLRFAGGLSLPNLARAVAAVPLVLVLLYTPFRIGMQITGGLDPNATVNAWGGPTYLGALLAHWLDGMIGCYTAAFLLSRILLPASGGIAEP